MVILLWAAGVILIGAMMAFMTYASTVGGMGVLTDSRYERCPRCGRHGLVHEGQLHARGCPAASGWHVAGLLNPARALHSGMHLRHH